MSEIRMHGRGGQGVVVAAEVMSNAMMKKGKYCSVFPSFGIERRGTAVIAFARVADSPVREKSKCYHPDILMVFDPSLLDKAETYKGFRTGGTIVACGTDPEVVLASGAKPGKLVMIDGLKIALEELKRNTTNMIMLGTFAKATGSVELQDLKEAMYSRLGKGIALKNENALQRGYDEAVTYIYDEIGYEEKSEPFFLKHIVSVQGPSIPAYEATWGDTTENYQIAPTGTWRFRRPIVDKSACIKCGICAIYCPLQCIRKDEEGYYIPDFDYCKACGICMNECPKKAISMQSEEK